MENLGAEDPRWIGEYRLIRRLGAGGMGRVFLARSARGRTVAVKLVQAELAQQAEFRRRFKQEVRAAQRVGGEWTAPVLDADTEAATPWVATGYIAGPSLHSVIKDSGPLPERTVRILANGLARALVSIHGAGLIHRDLKPSNILVTIDGPRVIDFGIARALETVTDGILTRSGAVVGSPGFMSPEQVRGERVDPPSDVFCLGSVLAFAATGRQPFGTADSGVHAVMYRIAQEQPLLDGLPESLRDLVTGCLEKDPAARPTVAELLERTGGDEDAETDADDPWLPGGLVAKLGRHAVQLLEAETPAAGSPQTPAPPSVAPSVAGATPAPPTIPPPPVAPPSAHSLSATSFPLAPAEPPTPTPPPPSAPPVAAGAAVSAPPSTPPSTPPGVPPVAPPSTPPAVPPGTPPSVAPADAAPPAPATPPTSAPAPTPASAEAAKAEAEVAETGETPAPEAAEPDSGAPGAAASEQHAAPAASPSQGFGPPEAFGPPEVTSFDASNATPGTGQGGGFGPLGPGTPGGPGATPPPPGPPARRRRKTLIVVSAAVATLLIAGVATFAVMKGNDDKHDKADGEGGKATPSAHASPGGHKSSGPSDDGSPSDSSTGLSSDGDIPATYLGAWEGEIEEDGEPTGKIRRIVLSQGPIGGKVADILTSADDSFCQGTGTLKSVDNLLVIDNESATGIPEDGCSGLGEQTLKLQNDGSIVWTPTDGSSSEATLRPSKSGDTPVPKTYVGTWLAKNAFGQSDATLKVTISQGAIGTEVAKIVDDSNRYHCEGARILASVGDGVVLSPVKVTKATPEDACDAGSSLTFTAAGADKLRVEYTSGVYDDEKETQTFTRVG